MDAAAALKKVRAASEVRLSADMGTFSAGGLGAYPEDIADALREATKATAAGKFWQVTTVLCERPTVLLIEIEGNTVWVHGARI